jgi:hypothetical protein
LPQRFDSLPHLVVEGHEVTVFDSGDYPFRFRIDMFAKPRD